MKPRVRASTALSCAVALGLLGATDLAHAQLNDGRLQQDVTFGVALGGGATFAGPVVSGAAALELRARYLDSAGLMVGAEWRPDGASRILVMADLRPLFLPRFFLGAQVGDRYWDLLIDSIGLDLGVAIAPLDESVGVAFAVGFGVDVPLVFFSDGGYDGLSLRLFGRHVASLPDDRFGPNTPLNDWIAGGLLVLRLGVESGLSSWEPPRYETRD